MKHVTVRRVGATALAVLVGVMGLIVLFSGPVPQVAADTLSRIVPPLSASAIQLLVAAALFALGIAYFWDGREAPDRWTPLTEEPPERPRNAPEIVGDAFETELRSVQSDIRLEERAYSETAPRHQLRAIVVKGLQLSDDQSEEDATQTVDLGEWTTDPIAAAFLSDNVEYPTRYQLFKWARPADAYDRAVERTSHAVDQFVHDELPGTSAGPPQDAASEMHDSWFERVRENGTAQDDELGGEDIDGDSDADTGDRTASDAVAESRGRDAPDTEPEVTDQARDSGGVIQEAPVDSTEDERQ